jgi:hypothetical protein
MPTRYLSITIVAAACALGLAGTAHAADVGVSIQFSEPGAYGRVDIGAYPQPQLIAPQPILIERPGRGLPPPEPVYLWVPPEHRLHWERYCGQYHACGHPVYFVHDDWYRRTVVAHPVRHEAMRHEEVHREEMRHDEGHHDDRDHGRGDENRERGRDRE